MSHTHTHTRSSAVLSLSFDFPFSNRAKTCDALPHVVLKDKGTDSWQKVAIGVCKAGSECNFELLVLHNYPPCTVRGPLFQWEVSCQQCHRVP